MKRIIGIFKQGWLIQLIGIVALCTLIWFAGPQVAIANRVPLETPFNRLLAILSVVVIWAVYNMFKQARAGQKDNQLVAELTASKADPARDTIAEAQKDEVTALHRKFEKALRLLKQTRAQGKHDKRYLYELPWYIIIGAPGCGKTTLLLNSGLKFPLAGHLTKDDVPGVGGTRNCDWLFTDDAIFLDTAGRFVTQDSHELVDAAGWKGFLDLIKKYRPRRPINGVLVTMSMDDLLRMTDDKLSQHSRTVRERIAELHSRLGSRFPIYMLFTKCDLVAGFSDFFADLSHDERAQVWGETFPGEDEGQADNHIARFDAAFEDLRRRLDQRTLRRIQEERDIQHRSLVLNFPQQLAKLKPAMMEFLQDTFGASSFEAQLLLRGIYFTSATQEGSPIDSVMGVISDTYGLEHQESGERSGQGKSFFITRFLKEVLFSEAELAGVDLRVERRKSLLQWATYASLTAITIGMITIWSISYATNKGAIGKVEKLIDQYQNISIENPTWDANIRSLMRRLQILENADGVLANRSWWTDFGPNPRQEIQTGIKSIRDKLLTKNLQPIIQAQLEARIFARLAQNRTSDPATLYELLQVYLMLNLPDKMNPKLAAECINFEWVRSFPRNPQIVSQLYAHTTNLLKLNLGSNKLDPWLISESRRVLNKKPLDAQIYDQLQSMARQKLACDVHLKETLGPYGDQVFTVADGQNIQAVSIPGLFTHQGYHDFFRKQGEDFVEQALAQNWVIDSYAADDPSDLPRLYDYLQRHYFNEYKIKWRALLNSLSLIRARDISQTLIAIDLLTGPQSPLRSLLQTVEKNTSLSKSESKKTSGTKSKLTQPSDIDKWQNGAVSKQARELEQSFKGLNSLVRSTGESPPPLDGVLKSLTDVQVFLMQISDAARSEEEALRIARNRMSGAGINDTIKKTQIEFNQQVEPLRSWLLSLTSFGWKQTLKTAKSELNVLWRSDVLAPYEGGLKGRYPLVKNSPLDATMTDFSRFFAPTGIVDQFFNAHLKPFVDTSRARWRQTSMDSQAIGLSNSALKQLQYAKKIKDSFFVPGKTNPSAQFQLKPQYLDQEVAVFRLNISGQTMEYSHGPPLPKSFEWPGPELSAGVRMMMRTHDGREVSHDVEGPWAWLRILDNALVKKLNIPDRFLVTFDIKGYKARYELQADSVYNPFFLTELHKFHCPESL